ncbi:hypothetical protein BASA50_002917 [Batrachochytrium salamandrivorans]|uniref:Dynein regulatory complex protein 10 n=1 Tax=Batrachochytrium salamandrivorans TaxID=1357716 RepID=A0ABQ8FJW6_9FUNG|nr:hypothetical protein BASA60_003144 [Batrachochytrium salamandrivorans]KAH6599575.1 hypothetical protein BASA50_002917 [Batrachochytrium salamandrivorans]
MATAMQDLGQSGNPYTLPPIHHGSHSNLSASSYTGMMGKPSSPTTASPSHYRTDDIHTNTNETLDAPSTNIIPGDDSLYSSKLTNLEAQRIMAVQYEMQRKIVLVGLLPDVTDRRVSTVFGSETFNMIKEYRQLELKYKSILDIRNSDSKPDSYTIEIKDTAKAIKTATRSITRHFLQNSSALAKLRYLKSGKSPVVAQFEHLLQEIKMLVYGRLKTTVEEERDKQDQLAVIIAKEKKTSNEVKFLKENLEKAKKERLGEINKRNEVIRRLKDELREIKRQAEEATKKLESKSKQKEDADIQHFTEKESVICSTIEALENHLETNKIKNREEEAILRKKKFKIESEVENWIHKYDQDMEEKQSEIDDVTGIFLEEKTHLDELQARYADLQQEYEAILEKRRKAEERNKEKERILKQQNKAATLIQSVYRGHVVRREMARKKNGKSGKKDKSKTKKK